MDERERLIRHALGEIEPDETQWPHFAVLAVPSGTCPESAVRRFLQRAPRPYPVPLEGVIYTVRHVAGTKVVFLDMRPVDRAGYHVEEAFRSSGVPTGPKGFFRA
ncbi:MAG: hypothetical protein VKO21_01060 [Candidatus Sericytochromatia bacterium]|nr:hypothetical protein [Candidatus Sericytochromatia bacterium]